MQIRPLDDRVVVIPFDPETTHSGKIVLLDWVRDNAWRGKVIAVGPGRLERKDKQYRRVPTNCRPGDIVVFERYRGDVIEDEGQEYFVMRDEDILMRVGDSA